MGFLLHGLPPGGVINGLEILPSDLLFCGVWLHNPEHCAIPFRGLVPLSPFKEREKERIRKASPFLLSSFFFGYGIFLLLLGFFHIPSAFSSHCLFSSLYFGIDYSCSPYSLIMDKKASCLKRWVLRLTCHLGKSV